MTLITTPGAVDANSYASLVEAVDYVSTLTFVKGWPSTEAEQEKVLKQAFVKMNTLEYKGRRSASAELQAGAFPRYGLYDADAYPVASNVVPKAVKIGQIELAMWLGKKNRNVDRAPARLKIGGLEIEGQSTTDFPDHVLAILAPFLQSYGNNISLVRG